MARIPKRVLRCLLFSFRHVRVVENSVCQSAFPFEFVIFELSVLFARDIMINEKHGTCESYGSGGRISSSPTCNQPIAVERRSGNGCFSFFGNGGFVQQNKSNALCKLKLLALCVAKQFWRLERHGGRWIKKEDEGFLRIPPRSFPLAL